VAETPDAVSTLLTMQRELVEPQRLADRPGSEREAYPLAPRRADYAAANILQINAE
jgi:hypothetical protein